MSQNLISIKTKRHKSLGVLTLIISRCCCRLHIWRRWWRTESFQVKGNYLILSNTLVKETLWHSERIEVPWCDKEIEEQHEQKRLYVDWFFGLYSRQAAQECFMGNLNLIETLKLRETLSTRSDSSETRIPSAIRWTESCHIIKICITAIDIASSQDIITSTNIEQ